MRRWSHIETDEERLERRAKEAAFWNRPEEVVLSELVLPEEDLPIDRRGGAYRWFRSPNVVDLAKARRGRHDHKR
jgi:hypothetical protein